MPLFHHFNVNDNIVLLISSLSRLSAWLMRALAKTSGVFYASTGAGILCMLTSAPIRAQMSRCVPSEDLGKVDTLCKLVLLSTTYYSGFCHVGKHGVTGAYSGQFSVH